MTKPEFKLEINLGNLLTILAVIVGFSVSWGVATERQAVMGKELITVSNEVSACEAKVEKHAADPVVHYMVSSPMEAKLDELNKKMEELRLEVVRLGTLLKTHISPSRG